MTYSKWALARISLIIEQVNDIDDCCRCCCDNSSPYRIAADIDDKPKITKIETKEPTLFRIFCRYVKMQIKRLLK